MKKNRSNRIKKIIFATIFTVCSGWGVLSSTMLSTVTANNKVSGNDIIQNYSQVPYEKSLNSLRTNSTPPVIDFKNDKKDAVDWSNENYPQISNIVKTSGEVDKLSSINNQLRTKYLNRSELYSPQEELTDLDNVFITQAAQDITLYANLKTEHFGINSVYFFYNSDRVFENMLKKTQYGSDDGYFLGDLTAQPLDSRKRESVQIKLIVPKGTGLIRVGGENESKYMIPRGNTFEYTEKNLDKTDAFPHVYITARLVDRDKLSDVIKEQQANINYQLENKFNINPNLVKLVPLGLNAGNVISNSQEVAITPFTIMKNNKILANNMLGKATLILTNGFTAHTEVFDRMTNGLSPEERRVKFEKSVNDSLELNEVGMTTNWNSDKTSTVVVGFSQLSSKDTLPDVSYNDGISATILHEFFHFLIFLNDNYKARPMFNGDTDAFKNKIEVLKTKEENKLAALLNNPYAKEDWEEYISEAFLAKNHPQTSIQTKFQEDIVLTNRFLDNLFDYESPSIPNGLAALDIHGESVKLTFNHSSDDVSVDKYNIYQDSRLIKTIDTKKDNNGLSYANPGDYQENIVINIDGLAQMTEYEFQVSAVDEAKNESEKSTPLKIKTKDTEPPELGGNLKGSALSSTAARFNWPRPTDEFGVSEVKIRRIESSSVLDFNFLSKAETTFTVPGDINFFTDATIEKGKKYTYSMTALDAAGNESERSNNVIIQTSDEDDDRKRNEDKAENTSSSSSTLNWSGSFDGVSASGFQLFSWFKGLGGWIFGGMIPVGGSDSSAEVSLTAGLLHMFVVIPVDEEGNPLHEGLEISVEALPNSVEGLRITDTKRTQITLEWENTNSNEEFKGNLYHDIYRDSMLVGTVNGSVTSYTDTALTPETVYDYYVVARIGEDNQSEKSLTVSGKTIDLYHDQMIRIESTLFPEEVLSHSNQTGDRVSVKSFVNESTQFIKIMYDDSKKAYQLVNSTTNEVLGIDSTHPTQVITDSNEKQDRQYWRLLDTFNDTMVIENYGSAGKVIEVTTDLVENNRTIELNDLNESSKAQQFQVLIDAEPPTAPSSLNYSNVTDTSVELKWEASTDNVGVSKYEIYNQFGLVGSVDGGTLTYVVESLESATLYQFTVKAVDGSGNSSLPSNELGVTTIPKAPVNLKAGELTESSAVLTWESEERPEVVTGYEIYKDGQLIQTIDKDSLTYKVEGLESVTAYTFTVKTKVGSNSSLPSNEVGVTTRPKAPVNLKAGELTESSAVLTWESGERPEVVTGYEIYKDGQLIQTVDKNSLTYKVEGLVSATAYTFTVKTKAGSNTSLSSNEILVTISSGEHDNLVINGNFSNGFEGWHLSGDGISIRENEHGNYVHMNSGRVARVSSSLISIDPNSVYEVSFLGYGDRGHIYGNGSLQLFKYNSQGSSPSIQNLNLKLNNKWEQYSTVINDGTEKYSDLYLDFTIQRSQGLQFTDVIVRKVD